MTAATSIANFGRTLAEARKLRGLSQRTLGESAGLTANYVQKIEAGLRLPTLQALNSLADALRVPLAFLIPTPAVHDQLSSIFADARSTARQFISASRAGC